MVNLTTRQDFRQAAHDTLFGGSFNLDHNLSAYNELVAEKYSGSPAVQTVTEYENIKSETTSETQIPAMHSVNLAGYYTPAQGFSRVESSPAQETYAQTKNFAPQETVLEQYVPAQRYSAFRPKIFDQDTLAEIDFSSYVQPTTDEVADTSQPILEVQFEQAQQQEIETVAETQELAEVTPIVKLNGKGMIAVISFIAVTMLVLALIIVNSVSISGAATRISALQVSTATAASIVADKEIENTQLYNKRVQDARNEVNAPSGEVTIGTQTESGYVYVGNNPVHINIPRWAIPKNPDSSTNFFDKMSQFLSKLFI